MNVCVCGFPSGIIRYNWNDEQHISMLPCARMRRTNLEVYTFVDVYAYACEGTLADSLFGTPACWLLTPPMHYQVPVDRYILFRAHKHTNSTCNAWHMFGQVHHKELSSTQSVAPRVFCKQKHRIHVLLLLFEQCLRYSGLLALLPA